MNTISKVHVIFKTHLDVGFTDFARNVVNDYFTLYIPKAIELARIMRVEGREERFRWTTGSWLIYEYLEQATPQARLLMEEAIDAGDIIWHGLPFTTHSELMDASLFRYGLSLAKSLDARFGKTTIAAKMTDVPGHTRAIVPLLAEAGIRFLHIGVNPASTPPDVPPVFVWRDPSGAEVVVMYHKGSYGDLMLVPGLAEAIVFAHTGDNQGPQGVDGIANAFKVIRTRFPHVPIVASTMNDYAQALLTVKERLPIITGELGDTWIHGVGTDPTKVSQYRALCRLRNAWLEAGKLSPDDEYFSGFSRALLMIPEHTWGMDEKNALADYVNYARSDFERARQADAPATQTPADCMPYRALKTPGRPCGFRSFEASWTEQRAYLATAIKALGQSPLANEARSMLAKMKPVPPEMTGYTRIDPAAPLETPHFTVCFDENTGAIVSLVHNARGREWAGAKNPFGLFHYETFSQQDYDRFAGQYLINMAEQGVWATPDFTKPGMAVAGAEHHQWYPALNGIYQRTDAAGTHLLLELGMPGKSMSKYGAPGKVTLEIDFSAGAPVIGFKLQWFDKPANRLPEALWFSFQPRTANPRGWFMDKMSQRISPLEVVSKGNRKLHAVITGVDYTDETGSLTIETLDAPLVAPGQPSLLNFDNQLPAMGQGMHFNLYNNIWGTNFPMWFEEDARFRFVVRFS